MSTRLQKIGELIKEELSLVFLYKIQDPELGMLTITSVKITPDAKIAKVYISIFEKEGRDLKIEKLNSLKGFIKVNLSRKVNHLRQMPDIVFYLDDTLDYVDKMEKLFKKIHEDDNK
ncbi:MAG: 30S ribosome-binding factor RbfA [Melioribacteraceae bacterium]|nr:30S ribosome-binding factor RbfA [Melioribacteraceae bacterium]